MVYGGSPQQVGKEGLPPGDQSLCSRSVNMGGECGTATKGSVPEALCSRGVNMTI